MLDEWQSKRALAAYGLPGPAGRLVEASDAVAAADALGYPVVVKAVSAELAYKTEAGAVKLDLNSAEAVQAAVSTLRHLSDRFLVERMAQEIVAELIVGVTRDAQFGLSLTVGAGGVLVELLRDTATVLLPVSTEEISTALASLKIYSLLTGYRGRTVGDVDALLGAVLAIASYAYEYRDTLVELDVNPLLVLPEGRGVLAVDALIRMIAER